MQAPVKTVKDTVRRFGLWALKFGKRVNYSRSRILILGHPGRTYGDAIFLEPAIRLIRRVLPKADLTLLGTDSYSEIFEPTGLLDHIIPWRSVRLSDLCRLNGFPFWNYEVVFETQQAFIFRTIIEWSIAWRSKFWQSDCVLERLFFKGAHETDDSLDVVARELKISITEKDRWPDLHLTQTEIEAGFNIVNGRLKGSLPVIGLHPGSGAGQHWKRWPADSFIAIGVKVLRELGGSIGVFGGPDELELNRLITMGIGKGAVDLTNVGTFRETAAAIMHCDAFIGNDSGLMHAANAVKTPLVAIFGPTFPAKSRPLGDPKSIRVLTPLTSCAYCSIKNGKQCAVITCQERSCLKSITPDFVFTALVSILRIKSHGGG